MNIWNRTEFAPLDARRLDAHALFADMCAFGACRIDHVFEPELVRSAYGASHRLLGLPTDELMRFKGPTECAGYLPGGVERVVGTQPDMGRHMWRVEHAENRASDFPSAVPEVAELCNALFREALIVSRHALGIIGHRLRKPEGHFDQLTEGGQHGLRLLGYRPLPDGQVDTRFPAHRDFGLLTMFVGGADPGLDIRIADRWRPAVNPAGSVILAAGSVLKMETQGVIQQLWHRVQCGASDRASLVFFAEPHREATLPNGEKVSAYYDRILKKIYGLT